MVIDPEYQKIIDKNPKTINGEPCKIVPLKQLFVTSKDHAIDEPIVKFGQFSKYKKGLI